MCLASFICLHLQSLQKQTKKKTNKKWDPEWALYQAESRGTFMVCEADEIYLKVWPYFTVLWTP